MMTLIILAHSGGGLQVRTQHNNWNVSVQHKIFFSCCLRKYLFSGADLEKWAHAEIKFPPVAAKLWSFNATLQQDVVGFGPICIVRGRRYD